jgi:hypothetical protein
MAAEQLSSNGFEVLVAERKPSLGRKFLMAGKTGLNLTKNEQMDSFIENFYEASEWMAPILRAFGPNAVEGWAKDLNQDTFTGSSGRVFPISMKASPLLRSWLKKLEHRGVRFEVNWNWVGWKGKKACFETEKGLVKIHPKVTILSLGGGSWKKLGSNGLWLDIFKLENIEVTKLRPANARLKIFWSDKMKASYGKPLKNIVLSGGDLQTKGEAIISKRGLEGSAVYTISKPAREGHVIELDLLPNMDKKILLEKLVKRKKKLTLSQFFRRALKLNREKIALFYEFADPLPSNNEGIATLLKRLQVNHSGLGSLDEAISTSGGVKKVSFNNSLMLYSKPGVFVAGEMLDWEAPTGGYLINGCLATGYWAGVKGAEWARNENL